MNDTTLVVIVALAVVAVVVITSGLLVRMVLNQSNRLVSAVVAKSGQELALLDRNSSKVQIPERKLAKVAEYETDFDEDRPIALGLGG